MRERVQTGEFRRQLLGSCILAAVILGVWAWVYLSGTELERGGAYVEVIHGDVLGEGGYIVLYRRVEKADSIAEAGSAIFGELEVNAEVVDPTTRDFAESGEHTNDEAFLASTRAAWVAAHRLAGMDAKEASTQLRVESVSAGGGSGLQVGDIIETIGGVAADAGEWRQQVRYGLIHSEESGHIWSRRVEVIYLREGRRGHYSMLVEATVLQRPNGVVVFGSVPYQVRTIITQDGVPTVQTPIDMNGASGGLMHTLVYLDHLLGGTLHGGRRIAGTGTVDPDGRVGSVGAVRIKAAAARQAGAEVLFVPREQYLEAAGIFTPVVPIDTVEDAVRWLCQNGGVSPLCQVEAGAESNRGRQGGW